MGSALWADVLVDLSVEMWETILAGLWTDLLLELQVMLEAVPSGDLFFEL